MAIVYKDYSFSWLVPACQISTPAAGVDLAL